MEIVSCEAEVIKFEKGNSIKDFYYWLLHLLSLEAYPVLIRTIQVNKWWWDMLDKTNKAYFSFKISEWKSQKLYEAI